MINVPDWLIRRMLAFVLGFCLSGMVSSCQQVFAVDLDKATAACSGDMHRLCTSPELAGAIIGNYKGIIACIRRERGKLSPECRAAMK